MLGRRPSPELISELLELFRSGELRLPFELRPLDDVADAIAAVRAGRIVGRILLDPGA
jgi:D-arabinose 1-dehydrogenase-like Zn-dependent alcohol dehydrogenase